MKPRHTAEQSTVAVNKAHRIGKIGFAAIGNMKSEVESASVAAVEAPMVDEKTMHLPIKTPTPVKPFKEVYSSSVMAEKTEGDEKSGDFSGSVGLVKSGRVEKEKVSISANTGVSEAKKMHIHAPTDPQEQFICDSCQ